MRGLNRGGVQCRLWALCKGPPVALRGPLPAGRFARRPEGVPPVCACESASEAPFASVFPGGGT